VRVVCVCVCVRPVCFFGKERGEGKGMRLEEGRARSSMYWYEVWVFSGSV